MKPLTKPSIYWDVILFWIGVIAVGGFFAACLAGFLVDHFGKVVQIR